MCQMSTKEKKPKACGEILKIWLKTITHFSFMPTKLTKLT